MLSNLYTLKSRRGLIHQDFVRNYQTTTFSMPYCFQLNRLIFEALLLETNYLLYKFLHFSHKIKIVLHKNLIFTVI